MQKWYEQRFVNRRDWILDHLGLLGLSPEEAVLALMIDFMSEHDMEISIDSLSAATGMEKEKVDAAVSVLCAKKYLEIRASSSRVVFRLDGLFSADTAKEEQILDGPLFDTFETEFRRQLSHAEMEKISELSRTTDRKLLLLALREASTYQKASLPYVERILNRWKAQGYTAEQIEEGKGHEDFRNSRTA
ncbi:DnaD domain-containing protein [Stecheria intestinalis]|uniref:DnaD domain-containing protein n=2 Tax=Erysipelotrichaceae TaxID=128827 RepID=UPI0023F480B8|nr:DnaD domain protein [Stecheria intestinalis]MDD5882230.1 DnaD domain protein [Stecheria intestinalis]